MKKRKIKVFEDLNNNQQNYEIMAIINDDVIKYIDFANNKMIVDINNNTIIRENYEFKFTLNFNNNIIEIDAKRLKKKFNKEIKTLLIERKGKSYLVRYKLLDENVFNEYFIKF